MSTRIGNKRYTARRPVYHKKHSNRTAGLAVLVVLVLALVAGISVYLWSRTYYADRITAGVTVNGQSVAGIAPEKLRSDLRAQYDEKIAKISVKIDYDGKSWEFNGQQLGAELLKISQGNGENRRLFLVFIADTGAEGFLTAFWQKNALPR